MSSAFCTYFYHIKYLLYRFILKIYLIFIYSNFNSIIYSRNCLLLLNLSLTIFIHFYYLIIIIHPNNTFYLLHILYIKTSYIFILLLFSYISIVLLAYYLLLHYHFNQNYYQNLPYNYIHIYNYHIKTYLYLFFISILLLKIYQKNVYLYQLLFLL